MTCDSTHNVLLSPCHGCAGEEKIYPDVDAVGFFRDVISGITTSNARAHGRFVFTFEKFLVGQRPLLTDISDTDIVRRYGAWLVDNGYSRSTRDNYMRAFRALYNKAVKRGLVPKTSAFDGLGSRKVRMPSRKIVEKPEVVIEDSLRWFAMKLRRGVVPADIIKRYGEIGETYYPCEEIARRVDGKMTMETRAVIADVLFFRSRRSDILPMFRAIGDMAWCYRQNGLPDSPYSVIPDSDMLRFQRTIGQFTPDMVVTPGDYADRGVGRKVRITGGIMEGYEGVIYSCPSSGDGRILRLQLINDCGIDVKVEIPESLIESIE